MYDPDRQYRCTIIRGKAQTELDNLLPAYSSIIDSVCPTHQDTFRQEFNNKLTLILGNPTKKTLDNHRTEIAGKLFGLWSEKDNLVYLSELGKFLVNKGDNPAFFKHIAIKLQFPNGMDKVQTIKDRIRHSIKFRPTPFILRTMQIAQEKRIFLTKREIGYYMLNSLDVLQGTVMPEDVVKTIINDREKGVVKQVHTPGKARSYDIQHISEFLNLLQLANLIIEERNDGTEKMYFLNHFEENIINKIINKYFNKISFDPYLYDFEDVEDVKRFYNDWIVYYTSMGGLDIELETKINSLVKDEELIVNNQFAFKKAKFSTATSVEIGEEGEKVALEYEKNRVGLFNPRLVNKVVYVGGLKGLGYDISSIVAKGNNPENKIYIEVKTTKRVTEPPDEFEDQFRMTRNEWVLAEQYPEDYYIYRIFLFSKGAKIFRMSSPAKLRLIDTVYAEPVEYRVEFSNISGSFINDE